MADDWRSAHRRIDARRIERGMSWKALQVAGNVSQKTLYKMRDDGVPLESEAKRASLSIALGWEPNGLNRILAGREPTERAADSMEIIGHATGEVSQPDDELGNRLERLERVLLAVCHLLEESLEIGPDVEAIAADLAARQQRPRSAAQ